MFVVNCGVIIDDFVRSFLISDQSPIQLVAREGRRYISKKYLFSCTKLLKTLFSLVLESYMLVIIVFVYPCWKLIGPSSTIFLLRPCS